MEITTASGKPIIDREKTAPFLIRAFIKIGGFHRLALFEDGTLPTTDEQQLFTWKDASLREVLTILRITSPQQAEYRHPLARYAFRALYADSANRGHFAQKELGIVYSRDILGEPGSAAAPALRLQEDADGERRAPTEREREERTLEELRFVPGDYLCVAVLLPKSVSLAAAGELAVKGSANGAGWRTAAPPGKGGDGGWPGAAPAAAPAGVGRGGGHWRGGSDGPAAGRGRGGRVDPPRRDIDRRDVDRRDVDRRDVDRRDVERRDVERRDVERRDVDRRDVDRRDVDRRDIGRRDVDRRDIGRRDIDRRDIDRDGDRDRRVPPPRRGRDSPPFRGGRPRDRISRSRSRSRSPPPPRRGSRYD